MSLAILYSRASCGVYAPLVTVETHISGGLPRFTIVGLPEAALRESKDRVRSAIINSHFNFPNKRITVNLAPANLPKQGSRFDLAIALGILIASKQIDSHDLTHLEFAGELALTGELRSIDACLPFVLANKKAKHQLILPQANASEASLVAHDHIFIANHLLEVCQQINQQAQLAKLTQSKSFLAQQYSSDISDVHGQHHAKRALEIMASGGHSLLMIGPPGTGKTMLASRLPTILPLLNDEDALEAAAILSIAGKKISPDTFNCRSFRQPHHSASSVALVGGGSPPKPGEISLAHNGILFLDELPEFSRNVLETLREPLESGKITISRAARQEEFPASFQLIAAMNPCPCGYANDEQHQCHCSADQIQRYRHKISGPLLDRIDLQIKMSRLKSSLILQTTTRKNETSHDVLKRVNACQQIQLQRQGYLNTKLSNSDIDIYCTLNQESHDFLAITIDKLDLSPRAYHRLLKVARTLADMANEKTILKNHLLEALSYRQQL